MYTEVFFRNPAIFESLEVLDTYLSRLRAQREERKRIRAEKERLMASIARVSAELEATCAEDEADIVAELQWVLQEFQRRLDSIQNTGQIAVASPYLPDSRTAVELPVEAPSEPQVATEEREIEAPQATLETPEEADTSAQTLTADRSLEEYEARKNNWLAEIEQLAVRWSELNKVGLTFNENTLNRPACFRLRALGCALARIQAEAIEAGMCDCVTDVVVDLRNKMEMARVYANDIEEALPFDPKVWKSETERLTAENWNELGWLYEQVAEAQEKYDQYLRIPEEDRGASTTDLLNAIGAAQQMLYIALEEHKTSDKLQSELYGNLKDAARATSHVKALHPEMSWKKLETLAGSLQDAWTRMQTEVEQKRARRAMEARKAAAIQAVREWQRNELATPIAPEHVETSRARLFDLLDECLEAGVPPTNVQVRAAIMEAAPVLLHEAPKYARFLKAVEDERNRKGLAQSVVVPEDNEEEDFSEAQIADYKAKICLYAEGQKVLILGGSARPQVAEKLKAILGCVDVEWADSKKGDRLNKYKAQIAHSDILVVVKKFASHEMTERGRILAKEMGKDFVLLPGGYGVNQIIYQMYEQLLPQETGKKLKRPAKRTVIPQLTSVHLYAK